MAEIISGMDSKAKEDYFILAKRWSRFRQNPERCSPAVLSKMTGKSAAWKQIWFDKGCPEGEDWGRIVQIRKKKIEDANVASSLKMDLSRKQMEEFFAPEVIDAIVKEKVAAGEFKDHPQAPGCEAGRIYFDVFIHKKLEATSSHTDTTELNHSGSCDASEGKELVEQMEGRFNQRPKAEFFANGTAAAEQPVRPKRDKKPKTDVDIAVQNVRKQNSKLASRVAELQSMGPLLRQLPQKWPHECADILKAHLKTIDAAMKRANAMLGNVKAGGQHAPSVSALDAMTKSLETCLAEKEYEYTEAKRMVKPKPKPRAKPKAGPA